MPCLLRRHEYRVPQKTEKNTIWNGAANRREHDVRQTIVGDELLATVVDRKWVGGIWCASARANESISKRARSITPTSLRLAGTLIALRPDWLDGAAESHSPEPIEQRGVGDDVCQLGVTACREYGRLLSAAHSRCCRGRGVR